MTRVFNSLFSFCLMLLAVAPFCSCDRDKTYSDYLKEEKQDIKNFISKNSISVTSTVQNGNDEWLDAEGNPIYYKFSDELYYHQIDKGDTTTLAPKTGSTVYVRYIGKNLAGKVYYDCSVSATANPENFKLLSSPDSDCTYGEGFQKAVRQLRADGHCTCIIPFKIGNGYNNTIYGTTISDAEEYMPMFYEIWVTRVE